MDKLSPYDNNGFALLNKSSLFICMCVGGIAQACVRDGYICGCTSGLCTCYGGGQRLTVGVFPFYIKSESPSEPGPH